MASIKCGHVLSHVLYNFRLVCKQMAARGRMQAKFYGSQFVSNVMTRPPDFSKATSTQLFFQHPQFGVRDAVSGGKQWSV